MTMYNSLLLQDCYNNIGVEVLLFHDYSLMVLVFILVGFLLFSVMILNTSGFLVSGYRSSEFLEFSWTVVPGFLLLSLGVPSLFLMYFMEGATKYDLTLKAMGHQWYWSYEMHEFGVEMSFDSYMKGDTEVGDYRLLDVDHRVILPYLSKIRVLISSGDVLHSWALPSMGVKADACPGRLNMLSVMSYRPGSIFGQCSEICGVNHSFMPIHLEFVDWDNYLSAVVS
uniref:cytochrome c oxidase subunit II n=1 Tax=Pyura mirabilis TaxID=111863 RepID=UPI002551E4DD|nr:cytochrome c oxidase subunit II [Pyura mirabilis]UPP55920.1 cytochrome c oxidase subunit II [Pyura mirabilis]